MLGSVRNARHPVLPHSIASRRASKTYAPRETLVKCSHALRNFLSADQVMSSDSSSENRFVRWSGSFADLSLADGRAVAELVKAGGAIQGNVEDILPRLRRTRMMTLLREVEGGRIVGVGALKTPLRNYRQSRFANAGASIKGFEEAPELGYVVVHSDWRGQRLSGDLVQTITEAIDGPLFATTDNNTMFNNLARSGFVRVGTDWQGSKALLSLWVFC